MACIDDGNILCDRQVVTEIAYSDKRWDLHAEIDFGQSNVPHIITILVEGTMTKGCTFQIVGANKDDFSDVKVIAASPAYTADQLVAGFVHHFTLTPTGTKYRFLALKFLPTGVTDESDDEKPATNCPPEEVLNPSTAPANSISAWHATIADYPHMYYKYANADKLTV